MSGHLQHTLDSLVKEARELAERGVAGVVLYGKRRPVGAPQTWGEALAAAVIAMFLFLWWYGVIPHQWLTWADNELNWRPDALLAGPASVLNALGLPMYVDTACGP